MKICLVGAYSDGLFGKATGGAEKQIAMLARGFTARGHQVTLVALEHEGPDVEREGVLVRSPWDSSRGIRWVRAVTHRMPSFQRVLHEVGADLYYVRGAMAYSSLVIRDAHRLGAPALLGLASDRDLTPDSGRVIADLGDSALDTAMSRALWLLLQRRALFSADAIIAQNHAQAAGCAAKGLPCVVIPSMVAPPAPDLVGRKAAYDVVWAGNVTGPGRRKGLADLVSVVEALPDVRFAVMGGLTDASATSHVARLEAAPNATVLGMLEYEQAQECLASSKLVLNTSPTEGFSNVMLEGWALGRPSVTLRVNPNGLLADGVWPTAGGDGRSLLGACAGGDQALLTRLIVRALADDESRAEIGRRGRNYCAVTHAPESVVARYEDVAAGILP